MNNLSNSRPTDDEHSEYFQRYISLVGKGPIVSLLAEQIESTARVFASLSDEESSFRYDPAKWSVKEVIGHLIDTERVMAYRALVFGRGDAAEIAGMDQDLYAANAGHHLCKSSELVEEFRAVRAGSLRFFNSLPEKAWSRGGIANGSYVTVRALAYIIAGHEIHHLNVLSERYPKS